MKMIDVNQCRSCGHEILPVPGRFQCIRCEINKVPIDLELLQGPVVIRG